MSHHRDEHLDLCAAYVLGVLDDAERRELEAHLAEGCERCETELRALSGGATVLAMSVPHVQAPAAVRGRVLAAIGGANVVPLPRRPRAQGATWAWAAAAALLAVAGVFAWRRGEGLSRQLAESRLKADALQRTLEEERRWANLLETPGARVVQLAPTPQGDRALAAQVVYDPASDRALVVAERMAAPSEKAYELWAITAAGPTSLGLVHADAGGRAVVRIEHVSHEGAVAAFAVSLESAGGSPDPHRPSGPVVMLGKLAG